MSKTLPRPRRGAKPAPLEPDVTPAQAAFRDDVDELLAQARALELRARRLSPKGARQVYVQYLASALYMADRLLQDAEQEARSLSFEWPASALDNDRPHTPNLVLLPRPAQVIDLTAYRLRREASQ